MKKLLVFLLFVAPSYAANIGIETKAESIDDFSGGLDTQKSASKLGNNYTPNAENGLIDEVPGSIVERKGFSISGGTSTLSKISFMHEFVKDNGDRELLVSDSSRILTTRDFVNYTLLKATLTTSAVLHMTQGRGKALICNGSDPCLYYDGTLCAFLDGNNGYPNVPRGKFPAFYQDRFWILNSTWNNSTLHFSENSSTDGFAIDPLTSIYAWPGNNRLNIGLGDGIPGSGLDVLRGQLQAHKEGGAIYTVFGTDASTYRERKTNAHSGTVSQDSIAQYDNLEYYLDKSGSYAFDSADSVRITDAIRPDIAAIVGGLSNIVANTWDTKTQFDTGGTYHQSTSNVAGTVSLFTGSSTINNLVDESTVPTVFNAFTLGPTGSTSTVSNGIFVSTKVFDTNYAGRPSKIRFWARRKSQAEAGCVSGPVPATPARVTITNLRTFASFTQGFAITEGSNDFLKKEVLVTMASGPIVTGPDINSGNLAMKIDFPDDDPTYCPYVIYVPTVSGNSELFFCPASSGQYISQITTVSNINYWDQFTAEDVPNGGRVDYFIKGATHSVNITTETWTPITSGGLIPLPTTKNYVQWCATFTFGPDVALPPTVDLVRINHNEGGTNDSRPIAAIWEGRYWLAVTTEIGSTQTPIYVKSRITNSVPNAWMKFTGINVRSFANFGGNFYGGSSTAGVILRLDNGKNDGGVAINWFYETPDLNMQRNYYEKKQAEHLFEVVKTAGGHLTIGTSVNGAAFVNQTYSIDGTGTLITAKKLNGVGSTVPLSGKYFRYRFSNNELDKSITFNSFAVLYYDTEVRD